MAGSSPRLSGSVLDALHTNPLQSDCPQKSSCAGLTRASTSPFSRSHDVDGRDEHGHDDSKGCVRSTSATGFAEPTAVAQGRHDEAGCVNQRFPTVGTGPPLSRATEESLTKLRCLR